MKMSVLWVVCVFSVFVVFPVHHAAGQSESSKAQDEESVVWEYDCSVTDGWIDNDIDPNIGTTLRMETGGTGVMVVKQEGKDTWGKTAILVNDVDLSEAPMLEARITKVDKGCAFKIGIAPTDWSDYIEVLKRSSADGAHKGDIEKAVKRAGRKDLLEGPVSFYLVVVVEGKGKSVYIDHIQIAAKK